MESKMNKHADRFNVDVLLVKRKQWLLLDILINYVRLDVELLAVWLGVDVALVRRVYQRDGLFDAEVAERLVEVFFVGVGG